MNIVKSFFYNIFVLLFAFSVSCFVKNIELSGDIFSLDNSSLIFVGLVLIFLGFLIRIYSSYIFYQTKIEVFTLKSQNFLITKFPFNFSRNPLYIGLIMFAFGVSLVNLSLASIIGSLVFTILVHVYIVKFEEVQMQDKFKDDYLKYKNKVPRWI